MNESNTPTKNVTLLIKIEKPPSTQIYGDIQENSKDIIASIETFF